MLPSTPTAIDEFQGLGGQRNVWPDPGRRFAPGRSSGDGGTRTRDFLLAKQVLYQLSYVPAHGV
jgi:hypothetical protein